MKFGFECVASQDRFNMSQCKAYLTDSDRLCVSSSTSYYLRYVQELWQHSFAQQPRFGAVVSPFFLVSTLFQHCFNRFQEVSTFDIFDSTCVSTFVFATFSVFAFVLAQGFGMFWYMSALAFQEISAPQLLPPGWAQALWLRD